MTAAGGEGRSVVAHRLKAYLRLTENWIRAQVEGLERYRPVILADAIVDADREALPPHHAPAELPPLRRAWSGVHRWIAGYPPGFLRLAREHGVGLVHAHFGPYGVRALPLARKLGVPLVTRFYGADATRLVAEDPAWRERYRRLFREGSRFLVEGPGLGERLRELGCPGGKITVLHLGVEPGDFEFRERRLTEGEPLRVLSVGRFTEKKGFVDGIRAVAALRDRGVDARLTLVGGADPWEESRREERRIHGAVRETGADDVVRFPGRRSVDDLRRVYLEHHVLLAPSRRARTGDTEGGAPMVLVEAHATGMPAVATRHADIPEVVRDEETGHLVPEGDPAALADALERFVREPGLLATMGRAARDRVEEAFSAPDLARDLEAVYDDVRGA